MGSAQTCQRLLTHAKLGRGSAGGSPQLLERGVDLERLGEVFGANGSDVVFGNAANGKGTEVSAAADTFQIGKVSRIAHLSDVNVLLTLRAALSLMMPSAV